MAVSRSVDSAIQEIERHRPDSDISMLYLCLVITTVQHIRNRFGHVTVSNEKSTNLFENVERLLVISLGLPIPIGGVFRISNLQNQRTGIIPARYRRNSERCQEVEQSPQLDRGAGEWHIQRDHESCK